MARPTESPEDLLAFARRLIEVRKARGMTQQQAANAMGTHLGNYTKLEQAKQGITGVTLRKICAVFDVSSDYLLFGVGGVARAERPASLQKLLDDEGDRLTREEQLYLVGLPPLEPDPGYRYHAKALANYRERELAASPAASDDSEDLAQRPEHKLQRRTRPVLVDAPAAPKKRGR